MELMGRRRIPGSNQYGQRCAGPVARRDGRERESPVPPKNWMMSGSEAVFVGVYDVNEGADVVAMGRAGFFFAHFQAGLGGGIVGFGTAHHVLAMGGFFGGGLFDVLTDPIADFAVGDGVFHDFNHFVVGEAGGLEPHAIETFAEIFRVIGVELAGEVKTDFINVTGQIHPAVHRLAGAAGAYSFFHEDMVGREAEMSTCALRIADCGLHGILNVELLNFELGKEEVLTSLFTILNSLFSAMLRRQESSLYDVAVVGGGSAGYAAARTAAAAGLRTVVIEGGAEVGGLCILRGCMPSKALLYAAEALHLARQGKTWGLRIPKAGFDFARVMARKRAMVEDFAAFRRQQLNEGRFDFLRARARFADGHTLELTARRANRNG